MKVKQVIVIRRDKKMRRGKEIAQGAHASMAWLTNRLQRDDAHPKVQRFWMGMSDEEIEWTKGLFTKVVLQVKSEQDILDLEKAAKEAGIYNVHVIRDEGLTEFDGVKTVTAIAIGPDKADKIDKITGDLKPY